MKRLSLQWRITIMTALLTCAACVLTNCLVGYTGMRYICLLYTSDAADE